MHNAHVKLQRPTVPFVAVVIGSKYAIWTKWEKIRYQSVINYQIRNFSQ